MLFGHEPQSGHMRNYVGHCMVHPAPHKHTHYSVMDYIYCSGDSTNSIQLFPIQQVSNNTFDMRCSFFLFLFSLLGLVKKKKN